MGWKAADAGGDKKNKAKNGDLQREEGANDAVCGDGDTSSDSGDSSKNNSKDNTDNSQQDSNQNNNNQNVCKIWLEVLPSKGGMLLAVLLAEIMTEGITPAQMNILGNFVSAVGSLISYKASREDLDFPPGPF